MSRCAIPSDRSLRRNAAIKVLADTIEVLGQMPDMPCSYCHRNNRSCIMDPLKSSSCSECVRRKGRCDGVDVGGKRERGSSLHTSLFTDNAVVTTTLREIRRLEEEEGKLMSKLVRVREQKLHMQRKQDSLFSRGMVEFENDLREEEGGGSAPAVGDTSTGDVLAVEGSGGEPDWMRELNAMSPGSLAQLAVSVGQDSGGANPRSPS